MKTIQLSPDLFAKLWALRQEGEADEEAILSRLLTEREGGTKPGGGGLHEPAYGLRFKEGFEISKDYLGVLYTAQVQHGHWKLANNGKMFRSLNAMTDSLTKSKTNAWAFWEYRDGQGKRRKLASLRPVDKIRRRTRQS